VWLVRASFASAYFDEQRRKQAEARVPFLLVPFLWARKEKALAYTRNKVPNQRTELSKELPIKNSSNQARTISLFNASAFVKASSKQYSTTRFHC
jgi:hypothetical protein